MAKITPWNITRHDLVGLKCQVIESRDCSQVGTSGTVIRESKKTLVLEVEGKAKRIPKSNATFQFFLKGSAVELEGKKLLGRPEDRLKKAR